MMVEKLKSSIKRDMVAVLLLAAFLPFSVASILLYRWNERSLDEARKEDRELVEQTKLALKAALRHIETETDLLLQSHELVDFVLAGADTRTYSSNLLYGRIKSIERKSPEKKSWYVLDSQNNVIFSEDGTPPPKKEGEGFVIADRKVVLARPILLDDQYLDMGALKNFGTVLLTLSVEDIKEQIPALDAISSLPRSIETGHLEIITKRKGHHSSVIHLIFCLAIVMAASLFIGTAIFYRRIIHPIESLTREVSVRAPLPRSSGPEENNELEILRVTFDRYVDFIKERAQQTAIIKTTQMLAHDIRRPFSMMRSLLKLIEQNRGAQHDLAIQFIPDVEKAIVSVDNMLSDIMEAGSQANLKIRPVDPTVVLAESIVDCARLSDRDGVRFLYDLRHSRFVNVDVSKVSRVFCNIIANALHAVSHDGAVWFRSVDKLNEIEFTIGNSGSYVTPDSVNAIFEAFYTENKPKGTGLGLAIAKKIVTDHGGMIRCESDREYGTEFVFSLPSGPMVDSLPNTILPTGVGEVAARHPVADASLRSDEIAALEQIRQQQKCKIKLLVVDDERLYRSSLREMVAWARAQGIDIDLYEACEPDEAIAQVQLVNPDLIILDIDLGHGRPSGLDIIRSLKANNSDAAICIHSNRPLREAYAGSVEFGADVYLPKPMGRIHLLHLIAGRISTPPSEAVPPREE